MGENHFILVSLDDSKSEAISKVLGNKSCKKIIAYLSEKKEASQNDLSNALNIPLNTLDYNIKKLLESGFIQKKKDFFWSKKGKKIIMYELSNKSIIISPKKSNFKKIKSIMPAFIITAIATSAIWIYEKTKYSLNYSKQSLVEPAREYIVKESPEVLLRGADAGNIIATSSDYAPLALSTPHLVWPWFLAGALIITLILSIVNWKKL